MKNILLYTGIMLIVWIVRLIALFIYPVVFLFREQIYNFADKHIKEECFKHYYYIKTFPKWKVYLHPYFWGFLFTTGFTRSYEGPVWYLANLKDKWFPYTPLQYFWLAYRWEGIRNGAWAFTEWFFREGMELSDTFDDVVNVVYQRTVLPLNEVVMPSAKFKNEKGEYMDNSGPYIRYPFDKESEYQDWMTTNEGTKIITFRTYKKNERFEFGHCKILDLKFMFLVVEILLGWDWWDGNVIFHFKFMPKKKDALSVSDYKKYKKLYYDQNS